MTTGAFIEIVTRRAENMINGLKREHDRPFSGFAYSPIEAVEKLREQILADLRR